MMIGTFVESWATKKLPIGSTEGQTKWW